MTKESFMLIGGFLFTLVLGTILFLYYTSPITPLNQGTVSFRVIEEGLYAQNAPERKNFRITNNEQLSMAWERAVGQDNPPPVIDFNEEQVLAVFAGDRSSAGYDIEVVKVEDTPDARSVFIRVTEPGSNCVLSQAITSPFVLVSVPASDLPLKRFEEVVTSHCE